MSSGKSLVIREALTQMVVVRANPDQFEKIEGNWYVDPTAVDASFLRRTEHDYRCPYKGRCVYIDFDDGMHRINRVAWVYVDVLAGWEHIHGKFGFYAADTARKFGKTIDSLS